MRVVHTDEPLPRKWRGLPGGERALHIADIAVSYRSRLRLKLLVFKTPRDLKYFWKAGLGRGDLGRHCVGAVNGLAIERIFFPKKGHPPKPSIIEVDPRYFAVMGLCTGHLSMEVICHEAGHAAFSYVNRVHNKSLWHGARDNDEEEVCYPLGRIASAVTQSLIEAKILPSH